MKKILLWPTAILTSLASLIAMCLFDFILRLLGYFVGKVAFLSELLDFAGGILDLGLTAIFACFIACAIWCFGHSIIEKLSAKEIEFQRSPVFYCNFAFAFVFLVATVILGFDFFALIGDVVTTYTADLHGFAKFAMFFYAIKDTYSFVCGEHIILHMVGSNSLILFFVNVLADKFIH